MTTEQLKQENDNLKKKVYALQKQVHEYKKQLNELKLQIQKHKSSNYNVNSKKKIIIVTSANTNDGGKSGNALLAKYGARKQSNENSPITSNKNAAANALFAKFGNKKKSEHDTKALLKKYNIMLKVGVDLSGVILQMKKDNMEQNLINKFNKSHGGSGLNEDEKEETDPIKLGLPPKAATEPPKQAMKRLHWTPVHIKKIKQSIWGKVNQTWNDEEALTLIELHFQRKKRMKKSRLSKKALKRAVDQECESKETVVFVAAKRSQQVQIGLRSYHMTNEQLRCMILALDDTKINNDGLSSLIDIIPTPEEQLLAEKMSEEKDINNFGISERFFYSLYDIVELQPRFKKWLFKLQFDEKIKSLQAQITAIKDAKSVIIKSKNLKQIFSVLLAFGNHMNYGNKLKGNCYGFHLTDLSLLPQIKTFDKSQTFPMFLYSFFEDRYTYLLNVINEFCSVQKASNIGVENIDKLYHEIVDEMKDLEAMIDRFKEEYIETLSDDDKFLKEMQIFQGMARKKMFKVKFQYKLLHKWEKQLIEYFAYDVDEHVNITKILKDLYLFVEMMQHSKIKLNDLAKQRKRRASLSKRKNSFRRRRSRSRSKSPTKSEDGNKDSKNMNVGLLSSYSKLIPMNNKSYANVDESFVVIIENSKKMPSKKLPPKPKKSKRDV